MTTMRPSRTTTALVRSVFPNPIPAWAVHACGRRTAVENNALAEYCVGGALYMYARSLPPSNAAFEQRFPSVDTVSSTLRKLQPLLASDNARQFAVELIVTNDDPALGGPAAAWPIVSAALLEQPLGRRNLLHLLRRKTDF